MSQQDVQTIRHLNLLFNETPGDIDAWLAYYHPDAEFQMPPESPEGHVYPGHEEIRQVAEAWLGSFDEYRWDEQDIIDAGDSVVALWQHRGRVGNDWIERQIGSVCTLRDGKVEKIVAYFSWDEALHAAGLPGLRQANGRA